MNEFRLDTRQLRSTMNRMLEGTEKRIEREMKNIESDWRNKAIDKAPIDEGALRQGITNDRGSRSKQYWSAKVKANVYNTSGTRFNYAYYIHELNNGGKSPKKAGTHNKFFDVTARERKGDWERWLSSAYKSSVKIGGF